MRPVRQHGIDEDHEAGAEEVFELGGFDFAIDLGERFFAAHGQQRVAEGDEDAQRAEDAGEMFQPAGGGLLGRIEAGLGEDGMQRRDVDACR